jgi:hypothetical protein
LKAGEWFRRGRLLMVSPVHGDYRRCQAEIPLIVLFRFPGPALAILSSAAVSSAILYAATVSSATVSSATVSSATNQFYLSAYL